MNARKHSTLAALLSALALLVNVAVYVWPAEPQTSSSPPPFAKGEQMLAKRSYREAAAEFDRLARENPGGKEPQKSYRLHALYLSGICHMRVQDWVQAKRRWESVVAEHAEDDPTTDSFPPALARAIISYVGLSEVATIEKDYSIARSYAEAARKILSARLLSVEDKMRQRAASQEDLRLRSWILAKKPFFDWKIAHPEQTEGDYQRTQLPAPVGRGATVLTSTTAPIRNSRITSGTCATSSCACGCDAPTTATTRAAAASCCKP